MTAEQSSQIPTLYLHESIQNGIDLEGIKELPNECCGFILDDGKFQILKPITNIQDQLHKEDPALYERDAKRAYSMNPFQLSRVLELVDQTPFKIHAIYHSHPDEDAYFSETDIRNAMFGDKPAFPDTHQLVLSIKDGKVKDRKAFRWSSGSKLYLPSKIEIKN